MTLRYDKLYMGHDVFFFNDRSGKVERLHGSLDTAGTATAVSGLIGSIAVNEGHVRRATTIIIIIMKDELPPSLLEMPP